MNKPKKAALSKTEYGIYFDYLNNPSGIAYNIPLFLKLDKDIDITRLKQAVEEVIENHPYIKSRLTADIDGAVYKLSSDEPAVVEVKKCTMLILTKKPCLSFRVTQRKTLSVLYY